MNLFGFLRRRGARTPQVGRPPGSGRWKDGRDFEAAAAAAAEIRALRADNERLTQMLIDSNEDIGERQIVVVKSIPDGLRSGIPDFIRNDRRGRDAVVSAVNYELEKRAWRSSGVRS